ncbi:hypothetical protein ORV05_16235 [Amycolatopsis cynarae]|uniref:Uncharacterized protein n=1 Tax=Amycolatopsis cynarae TaxID=2995223 RepID=A0ABY7BF42_9PSEU|nr:hypothetical protein [Amycolatopsis sp. HUAS 11-8]WAL69248.1 hypothetical protein ORV05_16235 [Amycolatopsis sp. HUAS 11-8]
MTYPPQPGQPGSGPHWGGFPQQPMPPGAPGQGPYYGPQSGPQSGPQPPAGGRKGLWIGLSVALVVVLAALGITGFWQPGFFLGGSSGGGAQAAATSPSPAPSRSSGAPSATRTPSSRSGGAPSKDVVVAEVQAFIDKLDTGDNAGAMAMVCEGGERAQSRAETESYVKTAAVQGTQLTVKTVRAAEGVGSAELDGTVAGKKLKDSAYVFTQPLNGQECVSDFLY